MRNAITVSGLKKSFSKGGFTLELPEFNVPEGYITGFIGENGAGKTTTLKLIMNLIHPDAGKIEVFGMDAQKDGEKIRQEIGYVGEQNGFMKQMKLKNIASIIAPFYQKWDSARFQEYLHRFSLDPNKKFEELSNGKQKQFALAMALSHHPRMLLMDEPTANLDPLVRQEVLDILADEMQEEGLTVFFSTHITSDLDKTADYIQFLHAGQLLLGGEKDVLLERHRIVKARAELFLPELEPLLKNLQKSDFGFRGLTSCFAEVQELLGEEAMYEKPAIEDIFLGYTKSERGNTL